MTSYITYLKDSVGNNYIGVKVSYDVVVPYLEQLKGVLGEDYDTYVKYQQQRDNNHHHITVINVMDCKKISDSIGIDKFANEIESLSKHAFDDVSLMGLGTASKNDNTTYFVVVSSDQLQEIRKKFDLPEQDFHITLGFKWKDVFGVRKNEVMKLKPPFLKLLKTEYYNNDETFEFVKKLDGFKWDLNEDVNVIEISDTFATFKVGENSFFHVSVLGDKLGIPASWNSTGEKSQPVLSNTVIARKLQ